MFERSLEEDGVSFRNIEFSSGVSLRQCLQRGVGITISPKIALQHELQNQTLKQLKTKDIITETPVVMIWHIDKWCSSLLKFFMDLTKESITDH
jgi:DNA-binding transcriptional LysR family regulator